MVNLDHVATTRQRHEDGRVSTDLFDREGTLLGEIPGDGEHLAINPAMIVPAPPGYTLVRYFYEEETDEGSILEEPILAFAVGGGGVTAYMLDGSSEGMDDDLWGIRRPDGKVEQIWNYTHADIADFEAYCLKQAREEVKRKTQLQAAGGAKGS
jgi:hypothetical protein